MFLVWFQKFATLMTGLACVCFGNLTDGHASHDCLKANLIHYFFKWPCAQTLVHFSSMLNIFSNSHQFSAYYRTDPSVITSINKIFCDLVNSMFHLPRFFSVNFAIPPWLFLILDWWLTMSPNFIPVASNWFDFPPTVQSVLPLSNIAERICVSPKSTATTLSPIG